MRRVICDASTYQDEILRDGPAGELPHAALKTYSGNMVLATSIRTATDLDVARRNGINQFGMCVQVLDE